MDTPIPARDWRIPLLLITGAVATIISLILMYGVGSIPFLSTAVPRGYGIQVASSALPLTPLRSIALKDGTAAQVTVPEQGTAVLIDEAAGNDAHYYLLSNPELTDVNVYGTVGNDNTRGLTQHTVEGGIKYALSLDKISDMLAYVVASSSDATPHVAVWSPALQKEKILDAGTHPHVLSGGFFVAYVNGSHLMSVNTQTGETHTLLNVIRNAPFAVDAEGMRVALYDPATKTIQEYSIAGMTAASYLSSTPADVAPIQLAYVDGEHISITSDMGAAMITRNGKTLSLPGIAERVRSGLDMLTFTHE